MISPLGIPEDIRVVLSSSGEPGHRTFSYQFPGDNGQVIIVTVAEDDPQLQSRVRQLEAQHEDEKYFPDMPLEHAVAERAGEGIRAELAKLQGALLPK